MSGESESLWQMLNSSELSRGYDLEKSLKISFHALVKSWTSCWLIWRAGVMVKLFLSLSICSANVFLSTLGLPLYETALLWRRTSSLTKYAVAISFQPYGAWLNQANRSPRTMSPGCRLRRFSISCSASVSWFIALYSLGSIGLSILAFKASAVAGIFWPET